MDPYDFTYACSGADAPPSGSGTRKGVERIDPFDAPPDYRILTFSGPSGAGKTTVIDELMRLHPEFTRVISCTTRPPRDSDPVGEYSYLSDEEFDDYVRMDSFLWTGAYAGHRYGTLVRSVQEALSSKFPRIMTLVPDKVSLLHGLHPRRILAFLITADEETIRRRLLDRGDPSGQVRKRLDENRAWERGGAFSTIPFITVLNEADDGAASATSEVIAHLKTLDVIA